MFIPTERNGIYSFGLRYPLPPKDAESDLKTAKLKHEIFGELQNFKAGYMYAIENFDQKLDGKRIIVSRYGESESPEICPQDPETLYLHIVRLEGDEREIFLEISFALVGGEIYERFLPQYRPEERSRLEQRDELSGFLSLLRNTCH